MWVADILDGTALAEVKAHLLEIRSVLLRIADLIESIGIAGLKSAIGEASIKQSFESFD
ncbi:MAG: hypothetical protein HC777_02735 [Hyphomonadaceae bacterium]|nr:hypothetical protein [Hyphomonadaceae bacterium]